MYIIHVLGERHEERKEVEQRIIRRQLLEQYVPIPKANINFERKGKFDPVANVMSDAGRALTN